VMLSKMNNLEMPALRGGCTGPKQSDCLVSESCPDGYYHEWVGPQEQDELKPPAGKAVC
jgi:hypothetical protein